MRNLFLALLLINLLAWAGFSWFGPAEQPISRYDGPGITLVREVEAAAESGLRLRQRSAAGRPSRVDDGDDDGSRNDNTDRGLSVDGIAPGDPETASESDVPAEAQADRDDQADDRQAGALTADAAPAAPEPPPRRCLSVGPFVDLGDAETAQARLAEDGMTSVQVESEEEIWDGYWVFLEGIENNDAASEMLEHLEVNGVEDTQLISRPETGILISLGVYSGLPRAGTRAEQVSRLGYEATVTERMRVADVIWLEVALDSDQSIEIDPLRPPGRISRLELRACRN